MSASKVARFGLLRPVAAMPRHPPRPVDGVWIQRHPSGASVILAEGTESRALATAVASMLSRLRTPAPSSSRPVSVNVARACTCGDCLPCELASMRSRKAVRHV